MYIKSINQIAGYIKIITIFLIVISLKIYGQAQQFIITNIADSVSITDNQEKVIAKIFWNNDTSSVNADTIDVSILPTPIIPPSSGGVNYALSPSIKLTTRQSIRFPYSRVKMRIYADTSMFKLRDLQINQNITNAVVYIDTLKSAFNSVNLSKTDYDKNFVEFYITQMSDSNIYLFSAVSILMGTKNAEDLDTLGTSVLVPSGKSLILNPGAKLYSSNYAMIYVKGSLICNGTEQSPVNLNIDVNIIGQPDTIISNNVEQLNCMYVQGTHLSISYSEAKIINSSFIGIGVSQFSYSELNNVTIQTLVNCSQSYIKIDSSRILSNGWITTNRAIAVIENSVFENYTYDSNQYYSFLFLKIT